jgi:putative SOS response-associated peptidase YedK
MAHGANVEIETYAFLTTTPNPLVATINHKRMPVLRRWHRNSFEASETSFAILDEFR